jgi:hypothetical protein
MIKFEKQSIKKTESIGLTYQTRNPGYEMRTIQ